MIVFFLCRGLFFDCELGNLLKVRAVLCDLNAAILLIDIAHYSVFSFAKSQQLGECLLCTGYWHEEWGGTCRQKVQNVLYLL